MLQHNRLGVFIVLWSAQDVEIILMYNAAKQWTREHLLLCGQHRMLRLFLMINAAIR